MNHVKVLQTEYTDPVQAYDEFGVALERCDMTGDCEPVLVSEAYLAPADF